MKGLHMNHNANTYEIQVFSRLGLSQLSKRYQVTMPPERKIKCDKLAEFNKNQLSMTEGY